MVSTSRLRINTKGNFDIIDITDEVSDRVRKSDIESGIVTVFIIGSTAGITTIENESGLLQDFKEAVEKLAPRDRPYLHDRAWGESNAFSHIRASVFGQSLTVPIVGRAMTLGAWQQIILMDFDIRPRSREVVIQTMGG